MRLRPLACALAFAVLPAPGTAADAPDASAPETTSVIRPEDLAVVSNRSVRRQAPERSHPAPDVRYADAWAALEAAHARMRETFASADGLALGQVELPHPSLGPLSLYQWGVAVAGHEGRHAAQIRECAAAVAGA